MKNTFTLPLALLRQERYAVERSAQQPGENEEKAVFLRMEDSLLDWLRQQIGAEGEVCSARFTRVRGEDGWYVTLRAECRERIDEERPCPSE